MTQLFSEEWIIALKDQCNTDPQIPMPLQRAAFTARIGYGFKGEPLPRCMLSIVDGKAQITQVIENVELDWDLRAHKKDWEDWIENGLGLSKLGWAVSTHSLEFAKGNYRKIITDLSLGKPFMNHFQLMQSIRITRG